MAILTSCGYTQENFINLEPIDNIIDLSLYSQSEWSKICLFGPYSSNNDVSQTLGFDWDITNKTSINNDGIVVIVYSNNEEVLEYYETTRKYDFSNLSLKCYTKGNASFKLINKMPVHISG